MFKYKYIIYTALQIGKFTKILYNITNSYSNIIYLLIIEYNKY